ncbi:phage baseplate assembly protein [Providencia rettgeri]|nr:phage baseplate assembly protein [Providencia rettgeri]EIU9514001.1 phage baseplate assembly protein [Providencia rettgeri]ELR5094054.1 phage baseplate assembly protein [Providencia rettgeri]
MSQILRDIKTRIAMMIGFGKTTLSEDGDNTQKVQYHNNMEVRDGTIRYTDFGFSSSLPAGSDVLIAYLNGNRSNAIIFASNHPSSRHQNLKSGESVLYNQWGLHILMTEEGVVIEAKDKEVTVNNAKKVTVNASTEVLLNTPILKVTGDIIDNCEGNKSTLKALRDSYNKHNHDVKNVQLGGSNITSEAIKEKV